MLIECLPDTHFTKIGWGIGEAIASGEAFAATARESTSKGACASGYVCEKSESQGINQNSLKAARVPTSNHNRLICLHLYGV